MFLFTKCFWSALGLLLFSLPLSAQAVKLDAKTVEAIAKFKELGFEYHDLALWPNDYSYNREGTIRDPIGISRLNVTNDVQLAKLPVFPERFTLQIYSDKVTADGLAELGRQTHLESLTLDTKKKLNQFIPAFEKLKTLKNLSFNDCRVTPAVLKGVAKMPSLIGFSISENREDETQDVFSQKASIRLIRDMKNIRQLNLSSTRFGDEELDQIKANPYTGLFLADTKITSVSLDTLKTIQSLMALDISSTKAMERNDDRDDLTSLPNLVDLDLSRTAVLSTYMQRLKKVKTLRVLTATNTIIDDDGLKELSEMKQLVALDLQNTSITSKGMVHIKGLSNLTYLDLSANDIDDAGIEQLHVLKNLKYLGLGTTKMTKTGLAKLKAALPKCLIVSSGEMHLKD